MTVGAAILITIHDADGAEISRASYPGPRVRIGRVEAIAGGRNDIVLPDDAVSREHAHLLLAGSTIDLVDLESRNGTLVNGQMVQQRRALQPGDSVGIGPYLLRCEAPKSTLTPLPKSPPPRPSAPTTADLAPVDPDLPDFDFTGESTGAPTGPPNPAPAPPSAAPSDAPDTRPSPPAANTHGEDLEAAYRALARQHGAAGWGRPPALSPTDGARVLPGIRTVVRAALWPERLADELCSTGPLAALLDDPEVTAFTVASVAPILVRRGSASEVASVRFSCVEALFACFERWTGAPLPDVGATSLRRPGALDVSILGRDLAPCGPVVHVVRSPRPSRGLPGLGLPPAAAALLTTAVDRRARIVVHGDASADLGPIAAAIAAARAPELLTVRISRSPLWPEDRAIVSLAGERPEALRSARGLHPDWLVIEELAPGDMLELRAVLAGPVGVLATMRARSGLDALQRLALALALDLGADATACRRELTRGLDLFIAVRQHGGQPRVASISESRPGGELVELFTVPPDHAVLEATGVEPQPLRERSA